VTRGPWRPPPSRPYRSRSRDATSAIMAAVRSRDSKAEVALRRILWRMGHRYRLHDRKLCGTPDLVFVRARVVVFVDGDYWHGRGILADGLAAFRRTLRTERRDWWVTKISGNVERDRKVTAALESLGWMVLRLWESEILKDSVAAALIVDGTLNARRGHRPLE
jgi:DNA mismatch endonuclease (patch repair protein)